MVDERLLPDGEYIDAMNIRVGSTESSNAGVVENVVGNKVLTKIVGPGNNELSPQAICIGAEEDSSNNKIYWFVHDPDFQPSPAGVCDLILSYDIVTQTLTYHVVSVNDGSGQRSVLNFNKQYLITGVNIIEGELLYFTDDYNPPRFINVNRKYDQPISMVDSSILYEQLLVIKKPPVKSPSVEPFATSGQENYMDTRFLSFAYRYRYEDGEYSATSQWSDIAFIPGKFEFSINSMLNEGMSNSCNSAYVTYNSGGSLVVGIDLLFKQSSNNIIKVIEKVDKEKMGLADNADYTFTFDSSKIFTILPDYELLRLYDNVPLTAKAQTIMGNRLMYGNYTEGYDMVDEDGSPTILSYTAELISEHIGTEELPTSTGAGSYYINGAVSVNDSIVYVDLAGIDLVEGASLSLSYTFKHKSFSGNTPYPTDTTDEVDIDFLFILPTSYSSVFDLATSQEFLAAVGTSLPSGNIKPVYSPVPGAQTSCNGNTSTDSFNCSIPANLNAFEKIDSGISAGGQAIKVVTSPGSTTIGFQLPAMRFVDDLVSPSLSVYEYYEVIYSSADWQAIASPRSLHSNRDYEVGIVYMDEFLRSSTSLVSPYNTVHIPCANSAKRNSIRVKIPADQVPPYWAKSYKFVIKPSAEFYETVYSNIFFKDADTGEVWFYLEGENSRKVETGDRLIVKSDSMGPTKSCIYATVLEKATKEPEFIDTTSGVAALGGVYMKINPSNFYAEEAPDATISFGSMSVTAPSGGNYAKLDYPVNKEDPSMPGTYIDYDIPAGSRIYIKADWERPGNPKGGSKPCEHRGYYLEKTYTSSADYANFEDWFNGDNIQLTINSGTSKDGDTELAFIQANGVLSTFDFNTCYLQFYRDPVSNKLDLQFSTGQSCTFIKKAYKEYNLSVTIIVYRADSKFIFETEPTESKPDVFFENHLSFQIVNGNHQGNVQGQSISGGVPAVVDTGFFNCFSFGNGVESYKVRDSIIGRHFNIGERVNVVSAQNYKNADRFSDVTYSGVYNPETNVNKLNEFNLGLLNYKNLEASFGPILLMDGRESDVLILQEDKISYVLSGKNLLSDAAAGGALASVPDVLGTQIARVEKYGISYNPESYVHWGEKRFFTDTKRGAVIMLTGGSSPQDNLTVISDNGMRPWFREEFNRSFNTQKKGGYDPYMDEYVLHTNDTKIPYKAPCIPCGTTQYINLQYEEVEGEDYAEYEFCVNLGPYIGDVEVLWDIAGDGIEEIGVDYNGSYTPSTGTYSGSGGMTFSKNSVSEDTVVVKIKYSETTSLSMNVKCPDANELTIIEVVVTSNNEAGETNHIQYRYEYGTYLSPMQSIPVVFQSYAGQPVISRYNSVSGFVGGAGFPPPGANVRIQSTKISPDTYNWDQDDKLRYLETNTLYQNTQSDISSLLQASSIAAPLVGSGGVLYADFPVVGGSNYLYLIWDFRDSSPMQLCHSELNSEAGKKDVCCDCIPCGDACINVSVYNPSSEDSAEVLFPFGDSNCGGENEIFSIELGPHETWEGCIDNSEDYELWVVVSGQAQVTTLSCGCGELPVLPGVPVIVFSEVEEGTELPGDIIEVVFS